MSSNDGGPAFPIAEYDLKNGHHDGRYEVLRQASGISVRDYFAAKAPQPGRAEVLSLVSGVRVREDVNWEKDNELWKSLQSFDEWWRTLSNAERYMLYAKCNYQYADAMLAERNKPNE